MGIGNVGINLSSASFKTSFIQSVADGIKENKKPSIDFLGITIGIDSELQEGMNSETLAESFIQSSQSENSSFKNTLMPALDPIFTIIDSIPSANVLSAIGVTDPTAPILPVVNSLADMLAEVGVESPNQSLLTKLPDLLDRSSELTSSVNKLSDLSNSNRVQNGINQMATILTEIFPELNLEEVKVKINDLKDQISEKLNAPEIENVLPSFNISDLPSLFGFDLPEDIDLKSLSPQDLLSVFFNFDLDFPPIGVLFVEMLKVKLGIIAEIALATTPAAILNPPDFLKAAIEEATKIPFSPADIYKSVAETFFNKFFADLQSNNKIKTLLEKSPSLVGVVNQTVLILVGSLVVAVIGVLFGEGLIMKSAAIGLGILK